MNPTRRAVMSVGVALALVACGGSSNKTSSAANANALVGLFRISAGQCAASTATGSSFRMVQPGGTATAGPFVSNPDSTCADQTVTPLSPGADGGLRSGAFQAQPEPAFGTDGGSKSGAVITPQAFFAVVFGVSTNARDPQTGATVAAPTVTRSGSSLQGELSAFSVSWNQQHFNQGAPKPGGPVTDGAKGSFDEVTGAYSLDWTSRIEGGPFNGFTGVWHLEGKFERA
ncbi:MAG: hypothetical protein QOC92_4761 [Acidimicrobiaceae bacterium]